MKTIEELARYYYETEKYNCSESVFLAANDYYKLGLDPNLYRFTSGFGAGMFSGQVCGALTSSVAIVSSMIIETKAREQMDILRPKIHRVVQIFEEQLEGLTCKELKPKYFTKEDMCLRTTMLAAKALELSIKEILD